jgi:LmbE family N-acetylglucosaminyl deacetylase
VPEGRIALVAAHPDDETIGAGGHLPLMPGIILLTVTDGSPVKATDMRGAGCASRMEYATLRRREMVAAVALAGVAEAQLQCFGIGDQQVSLEMAGLAYRLADWLRDKSIRLVLTHPYEMGHPDHDAVALSVHAAAALIARDGELQPRLVEFTSYHRGPRGEIVTGAFAPGADPGDSIALDTEVQRVKRRMLLAYWSQRSTLAPFGVEVERFRAAPAYTFIAPPHFNGAYYDRFDWGMRSERWRKLAAEALDTLGLGRC